jgi:hypothetical protein
MPGAEPPPEPGLRATLGGHLGAAGRANDRDHGAAFYRGFGRLADMSNRTYELGYFSEPIYPMNPRYQLSALYGVFRSAGAFSLALGALGHDGGWLGAVGWQYEILGFGLRLDGLEAGSLCGDSQGSLAYIVPEAGLRIPATPSLTVSGTAAYRGKLVKKRCEFRPSLLTLGLAAQYQATESWRFAAGAGHYGLHDFGAGSPSGPWPSRQTSSMFLQAGAAVSLGRITLRLDLRHITYANGVTEGTLGVEFRSRRDSP